MPRVKHHHHSSASSVDVSGGESDSSSAEEAQASPSATYSEGKTPKAAEAASSGNASAALCPAPVRMAIGVFSTLAAVAGAATAIVGGDALNRPGDPQADLHRIMLGAGFAALGLGACGALAAFVPLEKFTLHATPA